MIFKIFLFVLCLVLFVIFTFYLLVDFGQAKRKIDREMSQINQEKRNSSDRNTQYRRK